MANDQDTVLAAHLAIFMWLEPARCSRSSKRLGLCIAPTPRIADPDVVMPMWAQLLGLNPDEPGHGAGLTLHIDDDDGVFLRYRQNMLGLLRIPASMAETAILSGEARFILGYQPIADADAYADYLVRINESRDGTGAKISVTCD